VDRGSSSTYTLVRSSAEVSAEDSEAVTTDDEQGLRQRKGTTKGQQKDSEEEGDAKEHKADKPDSAEKEKKAVKTNRNPLHWFGLLVSPSLRTSQGHFQIGNVKKWPRQLTNPTLYLHLERIKSYNTPG
jgi:hypothetical protein